MHLKELIEIIHITHYTKTEENVKNKETVRDWESQVPGLAKQSPYVQKSL